MGLFIHKLAVIKFLNYLWEEALNWNNVMMTPVPFQTCKNLERGLCEGVFWDNTGETGDTCTVSNISSAKVSTCPEHFTTN